MTITETEETQVFEAKFPYGFEKIPLGEEIGEKVNQLHQLLQIDKEGGITFDREKKKVLYKEILTEAYGDNVFDENGIAHISGLRGDTFVNESGESIFGDNIFSSAENAELEEARIEAIRKGGLYIMRLEPDTAFGAPNFGEGYLENVIIRSPKLGRINNGNPVEYLKLNTVAVSGYIVISLYGNKFLFLDKEGNEIEKPEGFGELINFKKIAKNIGNSIMKIIKPSSKKENLN